jgi:hypothetical protein
VVGDDHDRPSTSRSVGSHAHSEYDSEASSGGPGHGRRAKSLPSARWRKTGFLYNSKAERHHGQRTSQQTEHDRRYGGLQE